MFCLLVHFPEASLDMGQAEGWSQSSVRLCPGVAGAQALGLASAASLHVHQQEEPVLRWLTSLAPPARALAGRSQEPRIPFGFPRV